MTTNICWLTNLKMATDEEKSKIEKLLQGLEVPEVKLTDRCSDLVKAFHQRFDGEVEVESRQETGDMNDLGENPYKVDRSLLEENEKKLRELLAETKRFVLFMYQSMQTHVHLMFMHLITLNFNDSEACIAPPYLHKSTGNLRL